MMIKEICNTFNYSARKISQEAFYTKSILAYMRNRLSRDAYTLFRNKYTYHYWCGIRLFWCDYKTLVVDNWNYDELIADIQEEYDMTGYITVLDDEYDIALLKEGN